MGLRYWWLGTGKRPGLGIAEAAARDPAFVASKVPELKGMSDVQGIAYTFREIERWRSTASPKEWDELKRRQARSAAPFQAEGLTLPYWGNLWLLRTYQRELGQDAPWVAPAKRKAPK